MKGSEQIDYEVVMLEFASNGIDAFVYVKDLEGQILYINRPLAERIRSVEMAPPGLEMSEVFGEDFSRIDHLYDSKVLAGGGDQAFQVEIDLGGEAPELAVGFKILHRVEGDKPVSIVSCLRLLKADDQSELFLRAQGESAFMRRQAVIFELGEALDSSEANLDASLQAAVMLIPRLFSSPDRFCCHIRLGPQIFRSGECLATPRAYQVELRLDGEITGSLNVGPCDPVDERFLAELEESDEALKTISASLATYIREFRYQQKYRNAMSRFKNTFEQAAVGLCHVSADGHFVSVNNRLCEFWGYSETQLQKMAFQDITHPADLEVDRENLNDLVAGTIDSYQIEKRYYRADSTIVWGRLTVSAVRNDDGAVAYFISVVEDITRQHRAEEQSAQFESRLSQTLMATISALSHAMDQRDDGAANHQQRIRAMAGAIAERLELDEFRRKGLDVASMVHDIGKFGVPAEILTRSGPLSDEEFALVREHSQLGYGILSEIDMPWPVADIVLQHHERLDGSGYPNGLRADDILLEARIMAVADSWESMSSVRPYRTAMEDEAILAEFGRLRGKTLDAEAVDACMDIIRSGTLPELR